MARFVLMLITTVRSTLRSEHRQVTLAGPKSANERLPLLASFTKALPLAPPVLQGSFSGRM
jgi:hypothetical protein